MDMDCDILLKTVLVICARNGGNLIIPREEWEKLALEQHLHLHTIVDDESIIMELAEPGSETCKELGE